MGWFKRIKDGIQTTTKDKKETPEGLWHKCPTCKHMLTTEEHADSLWVCDKCDKHHRIGSREYFHILFDNGRFKELDANLKPGDPLKFKDTKTYISRVKQSKEKSGLKEAIRTAHGVIEEQEIVIACMDFQFIGGSMGSVVGEKISRAIDVCLKKKVPLLIISKSGGARMMEAAFSLMQMAKTSAKLSMLAKAKIPYISLLTDPTTGGVTASFAMLGDVNLAEPKALIGFAGPRIVKETIGIDLPEGFQTAEFVLEHGFIDKIVNRKDLKNTISNLVKLFAN
ncbi:MAG: acetyl-CoA carboxylase carboxyltransferase subunit beta [Flavobacteriales bacterium]|nr:acetyl-CoA carboxylase carboxyltransferase subunit beta [Flavobacteriales bacterium]